ncbi:MAG TPA: S8 family serine peptidase [Sphingomicrobium sp.]
MNFWRALKRLALLCAALFVLAQVVPAAATSALSRPDQQILVMVRHPPDHYRPNGAYGGSYGDELTKSARDRLARRIAHQYGLTLVDAWPMPMIGMDCFVMAVPDGRSTTAAAKQVSHDASVSWSQPVALYGAQGSAAAADDPLFLAQPAAAQWHLADLHRIATGRGVKVAVIDSGIEGTHPDLSGQLVVNRNFVAGQPAAAEQHGTGVAGIIAAKADNGAGIEGVAPDARLLGLRACWQSGSSAAATVCDSFSLAKALYFAISQGAEVINLSLSGPDDRLLRELIRTALAHGSAVVAAFDAKRADGGFPASVPGVVAVSDVSLAASRGHVYTAPGRDVPTTQPGGRWFLVNGSSYAAAHVSGLLALVRQRHSSATASLVSERVGGGPIDACATLVKAASGCDCPCGNYRFSNARAAR